MCPMIDMSGEDFDNTQEPYAVKAGEEYKLVIVDVKEGKDKNGLDYLQPRLEVVGEPFAKDFTHFMHLPNKAEMSDKQLNRVRWNMKSFAECFGIDLGRPQDPKEDWVGMEGFAILGISKSEEYGEQNFVKKLITPK
jgi:hypothetical protein